MVMKVVWSSRLWLRVGKCSF